jgi:uncharacterized protein YidB (DUF937 family)
MDTFAGGLHDDQVNHWGGIQPKEKIMGLVDELLGKNLGAIAGTALKNPQIVGAVASLLSSKQGSVGGPGGLAGLVQAFQGNGMGDMISSWISTGPNPPATADQIASALGPDTLSQFAQKAGIAQGEAGGLLASLLPSVIDQLTPNGQVPESNALESALGGLLSGLMK